MRKIKVLFVLIIPILCFFEESLGKAPVTIFYGLNESHSNSWAQITADGTIGVSIFRHNSSNHAAGNLIYKTILPNGEEKSEEIMAGSHLENSILLYDSLSNPHIFLAVSNDSSQTIQHFFQDGKGNWQNEMIFDFSNEGGKYIYELSGDTGPDDSFHLLALKLGSNPDSDDYWYAYLNSNLYYLNNSAGIWEKESIDRYHTLYTMDEYSKMLNRQDIQVDQNGKAHIIYNEQANGEDWSRSYDILHYGTNQTGEWSFEAVIECEQHTRCSAGWYSSLALDSNNIPHISCCNISRVTTGSANNAKLIYLSKNENNWIQDTVCENDDGYYGSDGRRYTGGLTHLIFDENNSPGIVFSDIASSHSGTNYFNLGNIRYAYKKDQDWIINKIHQHPLPNGRYNATEIYDLCVMSNRNNGTIHIIGQQLQVFDPESYLFSLVHYQMNSETQIFHDQKEDNRIHKISNFPNPFHEETTIVFTIESAAQTSLTIYNSEGKLIKTILNGIKPPGIYYETWDGTDKNDMKVSSGVYFCSISANGIITTKRMLLLK